MALTEVNSLGIKALEVKTGDIAADAIDGTKLADNACDSEHYTDGSIDHVHLANDAVDGDNLADNACDSEHYTDGSIDHAHLANDCVDGDNIADDSINSEHYVAASIDHEHLADDCVDGDNIADNSVGLAAMAGIARGKLIVGDSNGDPAYLAAGSNDHVLTMDANGDVGWEAAAGGGASLSNDGNNRVTTADGSGGINGEATLTYDGTTLNINNPTPKFTLTDSDTTGPPVCLVDGSGGDLDLEADINNAKSSSKVRVFIDGSEKVRFQTAGGMSFNGDTAAANALDDYEEGDWTPGSAASTASSVTGKYTKIGRQVIFEGSLTFGSESGNNAAQITGLPFSASGAYGGGYIRYTNVNPGEEWFSLDISSGEDTIQMNESSPDSIKRNDVSGKRLDFCGQYIV